MKYLMVYRPAVPESEMEPPTEEKMAEMGALIEESFASGILLATEGCMPSAFGKRVRLNGGKVTVIDGPFTESKELIAGFALVRLNSIAEATAFAERFLKVAGDGETEIRQIFEEGDDFNATFEQAQAAGARS